MALATAAGVAGGGASGRGTVMRIATLEEFTERLPVILTEPGPHFLVVPTGTTHPLPPVDHSDHAERIVALRRGLGID